MSMDVPLYGFGGGGTALNFAVKGFATEEELNAAKPRENTIGVVTETAIKIWTFTPFEPEEKAEGTLWISVGTSGDTKFNALKKNALMIFPVNAQIYNGSSWEKKEAKIYQNSAWKDLWNGQLYDAGNQYTDITGGWTKNEADVSITFNESSIDFADTAGTANRAAMFTGKKMDVTNFNKLVIEGSDLTNITIGITEANNTAYPTFVASAASKELDLSGTSGSFYICIAATYTTTAKITKISLM